MQWACRWLGHRYNQRYYGKCIRQAYPYPVRPLVATGFYGSVNRYRRRLEGAAYYGPIKRKGRRLSKREG